MNIYILFIYTIVKKCILYFLALSSCHCSGNIRGNTTSPLSLLFCHFFFTILILTQMLCSSSLLEKYEAKSVLTFQMQCSTLCSSIRYFCSTCCLRWNEGYQPLLKKKKSFPSSNMYGISAYSWWRDVT